MELNIISNIHRLFWFDGLFPSKFIVLGKKIQLVNNKLKIIDLLIEKYIIKSTSWVARFILCPNLELDNQ